MNSVTKWIGGLGAAVLALAVIVPLALEDEVGARSLAAAREQLRTSLEVEDVSLSLIRDFPYASVALENVQLGGYPEGEFLSAERVSARVSYYDLLFADDWTFESIKLSSGALHVHRSEDRLGNWMIVRPRQDTSLAPSDINFDLRRIVLDRVTIDYNDEATDTEVSLRVDEGELGGAFGTQAYILTGSFAGQSHFIDIGELRYAEDVALGADLALHIDVAANTYTFGQTTIVLDEMPVGLNGVIGFDGPATVYDLGLSTDEGRLGPLLKVLPYEWVTTSIRQLDTHGNFHLDGSVVGKHSASEAPHINFTGSLRDGSLSLPALNRKATNVSFTLDYTNGEQNSGMANSILRLSGVDARLDGQPLKGSFAWSDFNDPLYDANITGALPLSWLDDVWEGGEMHGDLKFSNFRIAGRQRHLTNSAFAKQVTTSGNIALHEVSVDYQGEHFDIAARGLRVNGPNLNIDGAQVAGLGNTLSANLKVGDLVPYLLGDSKQVLAFDGAITTNDVDLDRWVSLLGGDAEVDGLTAKGSAKLVDRPLAAGYSANLKLSAGKVRYGDVRAARFSGSCNLKNSDLRVQGEGYAMEGVWEVEGNVSLRTRPTLGAKLSCSEVNITELFEQTHNVGQQVVEAKHLDGSMTARAYVDAAWDERGELLTDKLHVWANVGLADGGLRDFEMLQALSSYVRSSDLRDIKFTDVENWIEVTNERVYLPAMFIQSSATNFTVAGEHSFNHDIDYSVRVNGAQVLLTKLLGKRTGIDFLPDKRSGWVKTGFKIDGTLLGDRYDVRMAGAEVRRDFRHSQLRKAQIRRKLTGLFGAESLIDDYDDEGERRTDRPASRSAALAQARNTTPQRSVEVDTETYIHWEGDAAESPSSGAQASPVLSGARPALSGASLSNTRTPQAEAGADNSSSPTREVIELPPPTAQRTPPADAYAAPLEYEQPEERKRTYEVSTPDDDEFLEGFDDVVIPD